MKIKRRIQVSEMRRVGQVPGKIKKALEKAFFGDYT
jgi:hypothetical protein